MENSNYFQSSKDISKTLSFIRNDESDKNLIKMDNDIKYKKINGIDEEKFHPELPNSNNYCKNSISMYNSKKPSSENDSSNVFDINILLNNYCNTG